MKKEELNEKRNIVCEHCVLFDHDCEGWHTVSNCPVYIGLPYMQNIKEDKEPRD